MSAPIVRVLKVPPSAMGVRPVREGVLQRQLVAEQRANPESGTFTAPLEAPPPPNPADGILVPEEPTPAMIAAADAVLALPFVEAEYGPGARDAAIRNTWSAMLEARYDPPPMDTQSLFGASKSEIEAALVLYRKMKAPRKRGAKKAP